MNIWTKSPTTVLRPAMTARRRAVAVPRRAARWLGERAERRSPVPGQGPGYPLPYPRLAVAVLTCLLTTAASNQGIDTPL